MAHLDLQRRVSDIEQRIFIKLMYCANYTAAFTHQVLLVVVPGRALPERTVRFWVVRFMDGHTSVDDEPRQKRQKPLWTLIMELQCLNE